MTVFKINAKEEKGRLLRKLDRDCDSQRELYSMLKQSRDSLQYINGVENRLTPLMFAASYCRLDVIDSLLRCGFLVNETNSLGKTAIMYAADNGMSDAIRFLIENGADLSLQDHQGMTCKAFAENAIIDRETKRNIVNLIDSYQDACFQNRTLDNAISSACETEQVAF